MKKLTLMLAFLIALATSTFAINEVTVSGANGITDGTGYSTLSAAFAAINAQKANQATKNIIVRINASTTETTFAELNAGTWSSVTVYPTASGLTVSGSLTNPLLYLNGANKLTIDGRVNATGNVADLTVVNTNTGAGNTSTIRLVNSATENTIKYCKLKGSQTNASTGIIWLSSASEGSGNSSNILEYNEITAADDANRPYNTVYASGSNGYANASNTIRYNNFYNFLNKGVASNGINIGAYNSNWTIQGNSFYETEEFITTATVNYSILSINSTTISGFTISDNLIGGQAPQCGGSAWTKTGSNNQFTGLYLNVGDCSVQNNTIKNISWTNTGAGAWYGINAAGGTINIGTITGNSIGDNTSIESIVFNTDVSTAINNTFYGVQIGSTGAVAVKNNKIGSIKSLNSLSTNNAPIIGISKTLGVGTVDITNNFIGSITTQNSIYNTLTTNASSEVAGIKIFSSVTGNIISNNTIANLTTGGNTSLVHAIFVGSSGSYTIDGNFICNLGASSNSAGAQVSGIYFNNNCNPTCSNNIISLNSNVEAQICGFLEQSTVAVTKLYHNTVYISGTAPSGGRRTCGIWTNATGAQSNRDFRNNNFINVRTNGGTASGSNAAINFASTTGGTLVCDYNNLYSATSAAVGVYNNGNNTFAGWKTIAIPANGGTYLPDLNSKNLNPTFAITNPLLSDAYYPGNGSLTTTNVIGAVGTDYAGATRHATTPTIGALEYGKAVYDGSAWNVGLAPNSSTTDAALTGNYIGAGFTCKSLTVNAGKQTTITTGTLAVNGDFTLKSDANNGTATFIDNGGTLTVTGGATKVEQYITAGRNWYFASPLDGDNSSVFDAAGTNKMYRYAETTKSWPEITDNTTALGANMAGYIANVGSTGVVTFTGGSLNTGAQSATALSYTSGDKAGYHLLGNPYPSYLDWTGSSRTNVDGAVWYRTKNTSGTYVFDTFNGTGTNNNGLGDVTAFIPPMQAFWVRVTAAGNGSVAFDNTDRSHRDASTNNFRAPKLNEQKVLRLQVSNGTNSDETLLVFNPAAQNIYDSFDAYKMSNNNVEVPELFTKADNSELVINGMSDFVLNQPMTLGFRTGKTAAFSIKTTELKNIPSDVQLVLIDKLLNNNEFDLTTGEEYHFVSDAVNTETRFSLIFRNKGVTTATNSTNGHNIRVFVDASKQLVIQANIATHYYVYNTTGQIVATGKTTIGNTLIGGLRPNSIYTVKTGNSVNRIITN